MVAEVEECMDYTKTPRYDEAPGEDNVNWQEHEFILAALGMKKVSTHVPLQFEGSAGGKKLKILIDGGSSSSLIQEKLAYELKLPIQTVDVVKFSLPNGS